MYEQLADANPSHAVTLLAELYDHYQSQADRSRYGLYVSRFFEFGINPGDKVLDIGSGHNPFPFATNLADLSLTNGNIGRAGFPFKYIGGKPVYECSIEQLPFEDQEFGFFGISRGYKNTLFINRLIRWLLLKWMPKFHLPRKRN